MRHISVTGTAQGRFDSHGHPKLRVSCNTVAGGTDLYLGFHFPASHGFLQQNSRIEPVSFSVSGSGQDGLVQETVEYLTVPGAEHSVFRTLLASDGFASSRRASKLLLDLQHGQQLEVMFVQQPAAYAVQYNLTGFSNSVAEVMRRCQMGDFSISRKRTTWSDYIKVVEVAGVLRVQQPVYRAALPVKRLP